MNKTLFALMGAAVIITGCEQKPMQTEMVVTEVVPVEEAVVVATPTAANAKNSLDWAGTYTGMLPCADCSGIKTELTLSSDGKYMLNELYENDGTDYYSDGNFTWNQAGNIITLSFEDPPNQYFVAENMLMKLDSEGQKATGSNASAYNLMKEKMAQ